MNGRNGAFQRLEIRRGHELEIDAPNTATARKVREAVEALASELDALVEFEEEDE